MRFLTQLSLRGWACGRGSENNSVQLGLEVARWRRAMTQAMKMSKPSRVCSAVLFTAVLTLAPRTVLAAPVMFDCQPAHESAPAEWFGGQWEQPITVRVDALSRMVEIYDEKGTLIAGSLRASRLSGLGGYEFDVRVDENVIRWGVVRMFGVSGYIDRKSGRIDVLWTNDDGQSEQSLTRQFHGTCHER